MPGQEQGAGVGGWGVARQAPASGSASRQASPLAAGKPGGSGPADRRAEARRVTAGRSSHLLQGSPEGTLISRSPQMGRKFCSLVILIPSEPRYTRSPFQL